MKTIRLIENIYLNSGGIYAKIGKTETSPVLLRNGELDNSAQTYSFLMLLILNQKISFKDIIDKDCETPFVVKIKRKLLDNLVGRSKKAYTDWNFAKFVRAICEEEFSIVDLTTLFYPRTVRISKHDFSKTIREQIDHNNPVQITYYNNREQRDMNAVVVGYSIYNDSLRLYCLDPCRSAPYDTYWNNIFDIYVNKDAIPDYCPVKEHGIYLSQVLYIDKTYKGRTEETRIINLFPNDHSEVDLFNEEELRF